MNDFWNKPHQQLLKTSNAHYALIGFLCLLWLKPALQELVSLWFFLSDSFSLFTLLKCDTATRAIMPGCCAPVSFLTAAVPLSLCPWVQNMCCSGCTSGCHWAGVLVYLSFPLSIPLSIRSWCSCCALGSHSWSGNSGDNVSTNGSELLNCMLFRSLMYLKQYFLRKQLPQSSSLLGYFCNTCATNWLPLAEERWDIWEYQVFLFWWENVTTGEFA